MNAPLVGQVHSPVLLESVFLGAMMVGTFGDRPVLMVKHEGFTAVAGAYRQKHESPEAGKPVIMVSTGLVEALRGPTQETALAFVLAHEQGHVAHGHTSTLDGDANSSMEFQADAHALKHLRAQGVILEDAEAALDVVFQRMMTIAVGTPTALVLEKRRDALGDQVFLWERELSEAVRKNFQRSPPHAQLQPQRERME